MMNYYYLTSGIPDCREASDPSLRQRYDSMINSFYSIRLQPDVAEWDPTEYLPPSTLA